MHLPLLSEIKIAPKCRHFGVCGGCRFQDISYEKQLLEKESFIRNTFHSEISPILPSKQEWHYRNKMEFSFSEAKDGKKFLGLMQRGARGKVVLLEECFLTNFWFTDTLKRVFTWWSDSSLKAFRPNSNSGNLRTLTLREGMHTHEKMALLTVSEEISEKDLQNFVESVGHLDAVILRKQITAKKCPTRFEERILYGKGYIHEILHDADGTSWKFKIRPSSFFQPNSFMAEKVYQKATQNIRGGLIFDLFCGSGTIGIFASKKAEKVVGVELNHEAVLDGFDNIQGNRVTNMEIIEGDSGQVLEKLNTTPDILIVDPPRAGLGHHAISEILKLKPNKIIYISCNPLSQKEDCDKLSYKIEGLQPIDQFPHTPHIENIAFLSIE